jgi:hypothetical protein
MVVARGSRPSRTLFTLTIIPGAIAVALVFLAATALLFVVPRSTTRTV